MERLLIEVHGTVQGVGFRPHVYSLARALGLRGFAQNRGAHLFIDLEGDDAAVRTFVDLLKTRPPVRAVVDSITCRPAAPAQAFEFRLTTSAPTGDEIRMAPDVATCDACRAELFDPRNRRYRYPFITCAQCGPRYTIITGVPYDRARTTMSEFEMCEACRREYQDPGNRRFHVQAIACPDCGPGLTLHQGQVTVAEGDGALHAAATALTEGRIVAVKGLGGYHLACDATSAAAVATLRARKRRDAKPFAVMLSAEQLEALTQWPSVWDVLKGPERPIVLVDRSLLPHQLPGGVAPGYPAIGVMLPYTPVHHLLLASAGRPLVMTSGNLSDEPIVCDDDEARRRLGRIADLFLAHDRRIHVRCDDSVMRATGSGVLPVRRARGLAPAWIDLREATREPILATGGHLKNTFCLHTGDRAWVSSHIGDLESAAAYASLREAVEQATAMLDVHPGVVAHDRHPDYLSTRFAEECPAARRIAVQHHHAHVLSCAAEHGVTEPVLGIAFDGSGYGDDGTIWGGEFLLIERTAYTRLAHLSCVPLAGGEAAVREPWRTAVAHLVAAGHDRMIGALAERVGQARFAPVHQMILRRVGAPLTSSAGRLFDAVAAIAGLRDEAAFEGQAAMQLEALACVEARRFYAFDVATSTEPWHIHAAPLIRAIADDLLSGIDRGSIAAGFHAATSAMVADVASRLAARVGVSCVALTGGVFQNARLLHEAARALAQAGLNVLVHRRVPCNDGGLSLGQAVAAARLLRTQD